jgi:hypothetical protein
MSNLAADPCVRPSASTIKGMAAGILDKKFEVGNSLQSPADYVALRHVRRRSAKYGSCRQNTANYGTGSSGPDRFPSTNTCSGT